MIASMRNHGALPQADAKLVVLQPAAAELNAQPALIGSSALPAPSLGPRRALEAESSSQGSGSPEMYASLDLDRKQQEGANSLYSSSSSMGMHPGAVPPPSGEGQRRPPRLAQAWGETLKDTATVYRMALEELGDGPGAAGGVGGAQRLGPLEPQSARLDGTEPTTPPSDLAPRPPRGHTTRPRAKSPLVEK